MILEVMNTLVTADLSSYLHTHDTLAILNGHFHFHFNSFVVAQEVSNVDILRDITNAWNNFVKSGQIWALLIGMFFGYLFRGLTA
jgi:hypothetical protein